MKLSVVIPCYRSEATIENVVSEIENTIEPHGDEYEIILVNDCSPDNVWDRICALCDRDSHIRGICLAKNFGQHSALMAGYAASSGDIVISVDDDGQIPVDEMYLLIDGILKGDDVVYGTYEHKRHSPLRNLGSKINDRMAQGLIDKPKNLRVTSYFAARRFVIDEMLNYHNAYPYVIGLVLRTTKKIGNVPVHHRARAEGSSGYTFVKLISLWMNGFTAFSVKPLRLATFLGSICSAAGFIYGLYVVIRRIFNPEMLLGYSSLMAVMLFIGGLLMAMLGLIGEYIGRIYISLNDSPQYVIRETRNVAAQTRDNENEKS